MKTVFRGLDKDTCKYLNPQFKISAVIYFVLEILCLRSWVVLVIAHLHDPVFNDVPLR